MGLNDAHHTIDAIRSATVGPSAMYLTCLSDEIVAHTFPPNFKINNCEKYDDNQDPEICHRLPIRGQDCRR